MREYKQVQVYVYDMKYHEMIDSPSTSASSLSLHSGPLAEENCKHSIHSLHSQGIL